MNQLQISRWACAAVAVAAASIAPSAARAEASHLFGLDMLYVPRLAVPYVATPNAVVDGMLRLGGVGKDDVVYDLGCGDGRIVIAAAKQRGARGVGIDLNPERIVEARVNAYEAGVQDQVRFEKGDLFEIDFSSASVVTLFLVPEVNRRLRPQLWKQLKPGTRVVSHAFDMGPEWPADRSEKIGSTTIYLWTIRDEHKKAAET